VCNTFPFQRPYSHNPWLMWSDDCFQDQSMPIKSAPTVYVFIRASWQLFHATWRYETTCLQVVHTFFNIKLNIICNMKHFSNPHLKVWFSLFSYKLAKKHLHIYIYIYMRFARTHPLIFMWECFSKLHLKVQLTTF